MIGGGTVVKAIQQDIFRAFGKWAGSGAPANGLYTPKQRANGTGVLCRGFTLTRTAAGLYTLQWTGPSNVSSSVPNWLDTRVQVHSPAGTVYTGTVLSQSASTGAATLQIQTGGVNADPIANETIVVEAVFSDAANP